MSLGNFINIGKLGITGAIKQKLLEENISVKNFDISVWQEIMDTIKDDENLRKVYSGSTNLKDKNAFFVAKEVTVQISDTLWNKVLNIVSRHNGTLSKQPELYQIQKTPSSTQPREEQSVLKSFNLQAEYPELPYNKNGDIDFDELTEDKLRARFPESDYTIDKNNENGEFILIKSKSDEKIVFTCGKYTQESDNFQLVSMEHNGIPTGLSYKNGKLSAITTYNVNDYEYLLNTQKEFDINGQLIKMEMWNNDNTGYIEQEYSNGILYKETTYIKSEDDIFEETEHKNILSDKLVQDMTKIINTRESGIGFSPKTDGFENDVLNCISPNTVISILLDYNRSTGRELVQDIIDNKIGLEPEKQKELLLHITSAMRESYSVQPNDTEKNYEGQSLGYEMQFALKNNDKEMLEKVLSKVDKDNINNVLGKIYGTTENIKFTDCSDKLYYQLVQILGDDCGKYIPNFGNAMIQNIIERGGYVKDIVDDLNSHGDSWNKTLIDFTRLTNRCQAGQTSTVVGEPDGEIDTNNVQQKGTGDCWLIASILSATNKNQKGLDYINSLLSVDANGNVTVELKGVNKKYVISAEEISMSNHLASGDPDMRALEIAVDKYMKEQAYITSDNGNYDFSHADINGDWMKLAYNILFGNGYMDESPDFKQKDFNSENVIYSLSFDNFPNVKATVLGESEQSEVDLIGSHAYAIKGSDEGHIYLINPHDSSEILKIERALLQAKNPKLFYALIDTN